MLIVVNWAGRVISGTASSLTCKMPAVNSHKSVMKFGGFFLNRSHVLVSVGTGISLLG